MLNVVGSLLIKILIKTISLLFCSIRYTTVYTSTKTMETQMSLEKSLRKRTLDNLYHNPNTTVNNNLTNETCFA